VTHITEDGSGVAQLPEQGVLRGGQRVVVGLRFALLVVLLVVDLDPGDTQSLEPAGPRGPAQTGSGSWPSPHLAGGDAGLLVGVVDGRVRLHEVDLVLLVLVVLRVAFLKEEKRMVRLRPRPSRSSAPFPFR